MKNLIKKLTETFSPSGYESVVRDIVLAEINGYYDEAKVDALGNLIVRKKPSGQMTDPKRIMLAAHMDEIGIIATHIEETGFVRFTSIGGVNPQNLPGSRVRFVNGKQGVIGVEPLKSGDVISLEKCFIDVGFSGNMDHPIQIGDVAGFDREFLDLGDKVVAKALDDRIGVAVAIQALKAIKDNPNDLYFVFTTQEEVGTRGAETSAYGIDPDLGFSVDVTGWGDTPNQKNLAIYLGKGPAIKIKDSGMISDPRIVRWMTTTAEANHLPYQREVLLGGTTDARAMQLVRAGVPVGCVSIPCRYVHSPSEMVDINDVENAVKLITAMLSTNVEL